MRIGVLTGGGDCPGLNAVIRAIVRKATLDKGTEVFGFYDAWDGVMEQRGVVLNDASVRGTLPRGGTILGTRRNGRRGGSCEAFTFGFRYRRTRGDRG